MNIKRTFPRFLSTFDGATPPPATNQIQQVPAPPAAPVANTVSVDALGQLIDLSVQRHLRASQPQPAPAPQVQPPPRPAAPAQEEEPVGLTAQEAAKLRKEVRDSNARAEQLALETYKLQAIANARAGGIGLIESIVWGTTRQEIDQSIAYSAQEYTRLHAEWVKQQQAQQQQVPAPAASTQPDPQNQQPQIPQGYVQVQAPPSAAPQPAPQPQQMPQMPGFIAAPAAQTEPAQDVGAIFNYLTSSAAVRNGDYAANRNALMLSLRGQQAPNVSGQPWAFNPGYQVAPNVPRAPAQPPQQPMPAMGTNPYAGVQIPQVRPQTGILQQQQAPQMPFVPGVTPNYNPQVPQRMAPPTQGFQPSALNSAPQPQDINNGIALDGNAVSAAQAAAQTAIQNRRTQGQSNLPEFRRL